MSEHVCVPVVDLADPAGPNSVRSDLLAAYSNVGFAYLVGHGISEDLIGRVFEASRRFHNMPMAQKLAIELNQIHRGYIPIGTSTDRNSDLAHVTKPNQSASFIMMREAGSQDAEVQRGAYLAGPNQWPELDGFREVLEEYNNAMVDLAIRVIDMFARVLGDEGGDVARAFESPTTWLRLLHYPPATGTDKELYGSAPHVDFGAITILAQDDVGGLQVQTVEGEWIDVPHRDGAFVMNTGEMLRRWSNGRLLATPHRVINRSGRERYSCPFFFDPNVDTVVKPLPSCTDDSTPTTIEPVEYGTWLRNELQAGYEHHSTSNT